jgi:nicotinate-nucleotide adenylyltransferase
LQLVGILGGAFDPIHFGHLRLAEELSEALGMDEVRFIPTANPPHRASTAASVAQRVEMVALALQGNPKFVCDDTEIRRYAEHHLPSYTIDTLLSLHEESDGNTAFCLLLGSDAFLRLTSWHRWDELLDYCHIVVAHRPNSALSPEGFPPALRQAWEAHGTTSVQDLRNRAAGHIMLRPITALDISATRIRQDIELGKSPRYLLPDAVLDYIKTQRLYL